MDLFTIKTPNYVFAHQINLISRFQTHVLPVYPQIYGIMKKDNVSFALQAQVGTILQSNVLVVQKALFSIKLAINANVLKTCPT